MRVFLIGLSLLSAAKLIAVNLDITPIVHKIDSLQQSRQTSPTVDYDVFDPFAKAKPLLAQKKQPPITKKRIRPIIVQTILNRRALIDGKWYAVGSRIYGSTVTAVKQNHIVLAKNGKTVTIPLKTGKRIIITKEPDQ